ncbi:hypothetical protein Tco_0758310 [Tanacetum coccineum]
MFSIRKHHGGKFQSLSRPENVVRGRVNNKFDIVDIDLFTVRFAPYKRSTFEEINDEPLVTLQQTELKRYFVDIGEEWSGQFSVSIQEPIVAEVITQEPIMAEVIMSYAHSRKGRTRRFSWKDVVLEVILVKMQDRMRMSSIRMVFDSDPGKDEETKLQEENISLEMMTEMEGFINASGQ